MTPRRVAAILAFIVIPRATFADDAPPPAGVPPAVAPAEARKTLNIAEGLDAQLVAHEPMVQQPVSITFDDRGRLWVLEYLQYPIPNGVKAVEVDQYLRTRYDKVPDPPPPGPRGADRIVILDDADESGRYRRVKEFVAGLDLASGFALGDDGLYVAQPPYLLFYPDRDHDDRPDGDPEVLLKGFGMEDAHAFANSLTWGPDGWLYGAQGSTVTANIRGVEFQQGVWRHHHPRTRQFELFAEGGGNTWGIDFDREGQLFAGGNTTEPLCHHVQGAYYIKGFGKHGPLHNPYSFGYINPVKHRGFLGTGLTGGMVVYQGGLFPGRFDGVAIYSNLRANSARVSRLEPVGSTFTTRFQEDLIVSTDRWFRPIKSLVGPDGALYVADWYDYNISHTDPKDRSKWYQPSRETGRIWRVVPDGARPRADDKLPLGRLSSDELVELLNHPNAWYAREARRILAERRDPAVLPRLAALVRSQDDGRELEALWALYVSGGLTDDLALTLLDHTSEHVRAWTVRLLGDARRVDPRFNDCLVALARREPSATVRSQLAATCKRLPGPVALPVVEQLAGRSEDVEDLHIPLLLWWAVEDKALSDRARVLEMVDTTGGWNRPITQSFLVGRMARRYLADGTPEGYTTCARLIALAPSPAERERLYRAMELQMDGRHLDTPPGPLASAIGASLSSATPSPALVRLSLRLGLKSAYAPAEARAADAEIPARERAEFVRTLGELRRPESLAPLLRLLGDDEPTPVRAAALQALQCFDSPEVADTIVAHYPKMPAALRAPSRDVLVSRSGWSAMALSAVEKGTISPADFPLDQVRRILLHADPSHVSRVEKLWGRVRQATTREAEGRIAAVAGVLAKGQGDASRGRPIAARTCLTCHQLSGDGQKIGPDLTTVDRKNLDVLIRNVVDPSGVIREGYQQYVVASADGRVLSGLLAENSGGKVTVLDSRGVRTSLGETEVETIKRSDASLMPEGILDPLSDQEVRDLFAYLRSYDPGGPGDARPTGQAAGGAERRARD